jgi:hypothetical protein
MVSNAAVSQRRLVRATSAQMARAQYSASGYSMEKTVEPGAAPQSATMSRLTRPFPVSLMPSLVSPHAADSPAKVEVRVP